MKWCVCEVVQEFDKDFDGSLCQVVNVLQVFNTEDEADAAAEIFGPVRYDNFGTSVRVVSSDKLNERFR